MVRIVVGTDTTGCLRSVKAQGHATVGADGYSLICAAVTLLLRTAARLLSERMAVEVAAPHEGRFDFAVRNVPEGRAQYCSGVADFLLRGLRDVAGEYPEQVELELNRIREQGERIWHTKKAEEARRMGATRHQNDWE